MLLARQSCLPQIYGLCFQKEHLQPFGLEFKPVSSLIRSLFRGRKDREHPPSGALPAAGEDVFKIKELLICPEFWNTGSFWRRRIDETFTRAEEMFRNILWVEEMSWWFWCELRLWKHLYKVNCSVLLITHLFNHPDFFTPHIFYCWASSKSGNNTDLFRSVSSRPSA